MLVPALPFKSPLSGCVNSCVSEMPGTESRHFLRCPLFSVGAQPPFPGLLTGMMRRNAPGGFPQTQFRALNSKLQMPAKRPFAAAADCQGPCRKQGILEVKVVAATAKRSALAGSATRRNKL
jgi:hypothetical protein